MLKNLNLTKKATLFGSFIVVLCIAITAFASLWQIRTDILNKANESLNDRLKVFWEQLFAKDSNLINSKLEFQEKIKQARFKIEGKDFMIGMTILNEDKTVISQIQQFFGGNASIYMKDTRIVTTILNKDGTPAIGIRLPSVVSDTVIAKGRPYHGEETLLGNRYLVAYDPIKDNQTGEVLGAISVDAPRSTFVASLNRIMISIGVIAIALIVIINIFLFSLVKKFMLPLVQLAPIANRLAEGDLALEIETGRTDEVGQILMAMKNMVEKWKSIVADVKESSDNVASAGHELNANAEEMSHLSADQAHRATQVATAAEEMSQTVTDIARNVGTIAGSATETARVAKEGEDIVGKSVAEVREIAETVGKSGEFVKSLGERSKHIGEIINVINDIADQTNLLALNAAIEAARAGEQGRGFAVVADEVRKLAERTAHSTSEIDNMIKAIQSEVNNAVDSMETATKKVNVGVELSAHAGGSLKRIVEKVDELQLMVQQIASATEEMSATSDNISRDIEQIASISKETAMSSEQTTQAAGELSRLSVSLQKIVGGFTLG